MTEKIFCWVHLSDWHQGSNDFDRTVVRDALLDDLADRKAIDSRLGNLDLAIFSGDAAQSGQETEFQAAKTFFFDPVLTVVDVPRERLFLVPGNHDLDRKIIDEMMPAQLQKPLNSNVEVNYWLNHERRRNRALEPFENFEQFAAEYTGRSSHCYGSRMSMTSTGFGVVHVLGLNTSWMCGRRNEAGKNNDERQLAIGEPQVHENLKWLSEADLKIVVQHHPFSWLAGFDEQKVRRRISEKADFILWGHEHQSSVTASNGVGGRVIIIPAGASYDRRTAADPRYTNSYNFVCLDRETGQGTVYFRKWNEVATKWTADHDTYPGGCFQFDLPPEVINGSSHAANLRKQSAAKNAGVTYREMLLSSCDIIDLANLPGQDRLLVQRQLELRRLFVPLNVRIERPPTDENAWIELEKRRASGRLGALDGDATFKIGARLSTSKRLVILGDPGGGKTTLTRWIATSYLLKLKHDPNSSAVPEVESLPNEEWLPVLIRCRDLDREGSTDNLDSMLEQSLRKAELDSEAISHVMQYIREQIAGEKALLIIDGLDEISDVSRRMQLCQQIERIADLYRNLPIIATSRLVGYRQMGIRLGRNFEHLTLADLHPDEKYEFARRWCALTLPNGANDAAEQLIDDIKGSDRVQRLTGNPMLLTTMALVKRSIGRLPQRRAELYMEAVKALLNWRNERGQGLEVEEALPQLQYIAYSMCSLGIQSLRRDQLLDVIRQMRAAYPNVHAAGIHTPEEFIDLLESRTGILLEAGRVRHQGDEVPIYEFRHLSFQEFLAALSLVKRVHPGYTSGASLAQRVAPLVLHVESLEHSVTADNVGWEEVLRLCLTLCDPADSNAVLQCILCDTKGESSFVRAKLATACLADEPNVSDDAAIEVLRSYASFLGDIEHHGISFSEPGIKLARWHDEWIGALAENFEIVDPWKKIDYVSLIGIAAGYSYLKEAYVGLPDVKNIKANLLLDGTRQIIAVNRLNNMLFHKVIPQEDLESAGIVETVSQMLLSGPTTALLGLWLSNWVARHYDSEFSPSLILHQFTRADGNKKLDDFACWYFGAKPHEQALPHLIRCAHVFRNQERWRPIDAIIALESSEAIDFLSEATRRSSDDGNYIIRQLLQKRLVDVEGGISGYLTDEFCPLETIDRGDVLKGASSFKISPAVFIRTLDNVAEVLDTTVNYNANVVRLKKDYKRRMGKGHSL